MSTTTTLTLRREELYRAVWERPVQAVAASFGISGVALRKICLKLYVPVPPRGFWARKAAGREVKVSPLMGLPPGKPAEHTVTALRESRADPPEISAAIAREAEFMKPIVVPESFAQPHRLVRRAALVLRRAARPGGRTYLPFNEPCLDVTVGRESLDRALRILDALLKALEERGYRVEVTTPESADGGRPAAPSATRTLVDGEWICFKLEERRVQVRIPPPKGAPAYSLPTTEYRGTGQLVLRITNAPWSSKLRQAWADGKKQRVEACLGDFVLSLVRVAGARKEQKVEDDLRKRQWDEERKRREEQEKRDAIEQHLRYDLSVRAADWAEARQLVAFLDEVKLAFLARNDLDHDSRVLWERWLAWARERASTLAKDALWHLRMRKLPREPGHSSFLPTVTAADLAAYLAAWIPRPPGNAEY